MVTENNIVVITGEVSKEAVFSHEIYGEGFYMISLKVLRTSGYEDEILAMISERMCDVKSLKVGDKLKITGQFRSFNRHEAQKNRLILSVFVQALEYLDEYQDGLEENSIFLDGYIVKKPIYRETPLGRQIADVLLAANRAYGKSDYIPCICWGRNAVFVSEQPIGSRVQIHGRIQSREYVKKLPDTKEEKRVAYEVSVSKIELVEGKDNEY